jgi:hypothetical protein
MNDVIDFVKALNELDFICIDVDKRDTYIYKLLNDLVPFIEKIAQLERDVKRYFELEGNYQKSSHEYHELEYIKNKLLEVGHENE